LQKLNNMLTSIPINFKLAELHDLFTGHTEETLSMRHGIRYHVKLGKSDDLCLWTEEKVTSETTNDRLLLSDFNMGKIYVANVFPDINFNNAGSI